ncbi:hypothetical protein [Pseudomonas peli]|uniref:hypothetical protein n=1 Tax=Pseudomonas peli TaxID=592361 RepID=UPI0024AE54C6|nr:hypothetical protein [Pseudomonas peli]
MAELHETRTDSEVATQPYDQHDEEFPRKEIVEYFEHWKMTSILILRVERPADGRRTAIRWGEWLAMTRVVTISRVALS